MKMRRVSVSNSKPDLEAIITGENLHNVSQGVLENQDKNLRDII
jgi:hypothetical protein